MGMRKVGISRRLFMVADQTTEGAAREKNAK
jgi:hypothetical protein